MLRAGAARGAARGTAGRARRRAGRRGRAGAPRRPPSLIGSGACWSWASITHSAPPSSLIWAAGSNQTILLSASIVAPHAVAHWATIDRPRPKVSSRSRSSPTSGAGGTGGLVEPSITSMRGWLTVPRTRTLNGAVGVQDGVGHQLGDAELGALHEVVALEPRGHVAHPAPGVGRSARRRRQGQLGAQRHWDSFRGGGQSSGAMVTRARGSSNLDDHHSFSRLWVVDVSNETRPAFRLAGRPREDNGRTASARVNHPRPRTEELR